MTDIINTLTANPELTIMWAKVVIAAISTVAAVAGFIVMKKGI